MFLYYKLLYALCQLGVSRIVSLQPDYNISI
nr:MAG TPA: hypothetical protein [Caudoviricetes sp.]